VPPLRQRGDDVLRLAEVFAERAARRIRRTVRPLDLDARTRLRQYAWPGNVRELQNVIERAVVTARDGRLDLSRALGIQVADLPSGPIDTGAIYTADEMKSLERANIVRALERTRGRVSGDAGAARLLSMRPSTLSSRIAALGISLPRDYDA
jgi:transcriptional regulator with GAF, ATPase, and Fis domain